MISRRAFSIIEISVVILIIGILVSSISKGLDLYQDFRLTSARQLTNNSIVGRISGLTLWFETTSEKSFEKTNPIHNQLVSKWKNLNFQTVNNIDLTQSDINSQPLYITNTINNLPALDFNDGLRFFTSDPINYTDISGVENVTMFFVTKSLGTNLNNNPSVFFSYSEKNSNNVEVFRNYVYFFHNNNIKFQYGGPCGSASFSTNSCKATASNFFNTHSQNNYIITIYKNQNIGKIYVNNILDMTNSVFSDKYSETYIKNPLIIGSNLRSSLSLIGEMIVFNRSLSDNEIMKINDYLKNKWKI